MSKRDKFTRTWIIDNALEEIPNYEPGMLTLRGLHYRLVARGMTNTIQHYKRVVKAMIEARWDRLVDFDTFSDNERLDDGDTFFRSINLNEEIGTAKDQIGNWINTYHRSRWEKQPIYPEVFIEKNALFGVFEEPCQNHYVRLNTCKGYPSLTILYEAMKRFLVAQNAGMIPTILYFGDYDPSGEDIPRSIKDNLNRMGVEVRVDRVALVEAQVLEWDLPPAPVKSGDSRSAKWEGIGQVELDAIEPVTLREMCEQALRGVFDVDIFQEVLTQEKEEREIYVETLKKYVRSI